MKEYFVKFWTSNQKLSGTKVFAESPGQAMDMVRSSYDIDHVITWEPVETYTAPSPSRYVPNDFSNEYNNDYGYGSDDYGFNDY